MAGAHSSLILAKLNTPHIAASMQIQEEQLTIADTARDYFHINRAAPWSPFEMWREGQEIDIGGESNPYFKFFETQRKEYSVNTESGSIMVPAAKFVGSVARGEINSPHVADIASEVIRHFVAYVRELIWEDIRKQEFPHLPSRQRCIWLIPEREGVRFWLERLGLEGQSFQIARIRLQGRLHTGSDEHLLGDSEPMEMTLKRARQYWLGIHNDSATQEILFEGRLRVMEFLSPEEFA